MQTAEAGVLPMKARDEKRESISGLHLDLMTAKLLVWVASVGRDVDLTSDAAAMGMPRPRQWIATDVASRRHLGGPDDAA